MRILLVGFLIAFICGVEETAADRCVCTPACSQNLTLSQLLADQVDYVRMNCTGVSGAIPASVGGKTMLEAFDVWDSQQLLGPLPSELFSLPNLKRLAIVNALSLSGTIPRELANLANLEHVKIDNTGMGGQLQDIFAKVMRSVVHVHLEGNRLYGPLPLQMMINLPRLQVINVGFNLLNGTLPGLPAGSALTNMTLTSNYGVFGTIPSSYSKLQRLYVSSTGLCGDFPTSSNSDVYPGTLPSCPIPPQTLSPSTPTPSLSPTQPPVTARPTVSPIHVTPSPSVTSGPSRGPSAATLPPSPGSSGGEGNPVPKAIATPILSTLLGIAVLSRVGLEYML